MPEVKYFKTIKCTFRSDISCRSSIPGVNPIKVILSQKSTKSVPNSLTISYFSLNKKMKFFSSNKKKKHFKDVKNKFLSFYDIIFF